jgi:glutathione synthase/RimK-type ligase-like ATP-grasp enzyme
LPPDRDSFDIAFDKVRTLELARQIGVGTPATYLSTKKSDLPVVSRELTFPVVVKPLRSVSWNGARGLQTTACFAGAVQIPFG